MTSFLSGAVVAIGLSVVTWVGLNAFSQTQIERYYDPSLNLEGLDQEYGPESDTVPHDEIAG